MKFEKKRGEDTAVQMGSGSDERIASLFQPDVLLGEQYNDNFRRKVPLEPEKALLLAVLDDGVRCFQDNVLPQNKKKRYFLTKPRNGFSAMNRTGSSRSFRFAPRSVLIPVTSAGDSDNGSNGPWPRGERNSVAPGRCRSASSHKCEIAQHQRYAEMDFRFRNGACRLRCPGPLGRLREESTGVV